MGVEKMSGIYIPGAKIPDGDYVRVLMLHKDGTCVDGIGNVFNVIPVPPHGLIDRERILDSIRIELAQVNAVNDMEDYDSWMRVYDYVRKFPTVIPASGEGEA